MENIFKIIYLNKNSSNLSKNGLPHRKSDISSACDIGQFNSIETIHKLMVWKLHKLIKRPCIFVRNFFFLLNSNFYLHHFVQIRYKIVIYFFVFDQRS